MIRKSKLVLAVAGLLGMNMAMACSIAEWGKGSPTLPGGGVMTQGTAVGAPTPVQSEAAQTATGPKRYSGGCGLRSTAAGNYVQDGTPSGEASFIARFYVWTGATGETDVFHVRSNGANTGTDAAGVADDYNIARVTYDASASQIKFYDRNGGVNGVAANPNTWQAVELKWTRAASTLDVYVQGAASLTPNNPAAFNGFSVADGAHGVDYVRLGWIANGGTGNIYVDAYESRRSTDIGRLCRGDSNNSNNVSPADRSAITAELNLANVIRAAGQPDCNEDGRLSPADRSCVTGLLGLMKNACDGSW